MTRSRSIFSPRLEFETRRDEMLLFRLVELLPINVSAKRNEINQCEMTKTSIDRYRPVCCIPIWSSIAFERCSVIFLFSLSLSLRVSSRQRSWTWSSTPMQREESSVNFIFIASEREKKSNVFFHQWQINRRFNKRFRSNWSSSAMEPSAKPACWFPSPATLFPKNTFRQCNSFDRSRRKKRSSIVFLFFLRRIVSIITRRILSSITWTSHWAFGIRPVKKITIDYARCPTLKPTFFSFASVWSVRRRWKTLRTNGYRKSDTIVPKRRSFSAVKTKVSPPLVSIVV